jgi:hypothetical protein
MPEFVPKGWPSMSRHQIVNRYRTYKAYSIAAFIVWAVILAAMAIAGTSHKTHTFLLVFAGWAIGWLSATIARSVYPHPGAKLR